MKKDKCKGTKFIVTESFVGSKPAEQLFSELIEDKISENVWTSNATPDIINSTTVESESCCSSFRR